MPHRYGYVVARSSADGTNRYAAISRYNNLTSKLRTGWTTVLREPFYVSLNFSIWHMYFQFNWRSVYSKVISARCMYLYIYIYQCMRYMYIFRLLFCLSLILSYIVLTFVCFFFFRFLFCFCFLCFSRGSRYSSVYRQIFDFALMIFLLAFDYMYKLRAEQKLNKQIRANELCTLCHSLKTTIHPL